MHPLPRPEKQLPPSQSVIAALILVQFLFGMNYLFSKMILAEIPPLLWASARALITAIVFVVLCAAQGSLNISRGFFYYRPLILFSLLGVALNQGSFLMGLHHTTATNSALLNTLIPIFTILIVALRGQETVTLMRGTGFAFAFMGVLLIHRVEAFTVSNKTFLGDLLILLNTLFYSLFLAYSHRFFRKFDFVWSMTWLFVYGSLALTLFALPDWAAYEWKPLSITTWGCMLVSIFCGSVIPYLLVGFTLSKTQSSLVALFVYIQPLVASIMSYLFFREHIATRTIFAGALIFVGMFLAIMKRETSAEKRELPLGNVLHFKERTSPSDPTTEEPRKKAPQEDKAT